MSTGTAVWIGRLSALLAAILLATSYVATAFALRSFTPMAAAAWRGLLSTCVLVPLTVLELRGRRNVFRLAVLWRLAVLGVLGGLGLVIGMNLAIASAGATVASFCIALASVFATLIAPLVLPERLRPMALFGFVIAVLGTALMTGLAGSVPGASPLGVAAGLFGGVCFALFLVLARRWSGRFGLTNCLVALANAATIAIGLVAFELLIEPRAMWPGGIRLDAAMGLGWLVLGPGVAAQMLLVAGSRRLEVASSAAILLVKPVATAVIALLLLGELLQPIQALGGVIVLVGIALAEHRAFGPFAGAAGTPAGLDMLGPGASLPDLPK
ncbi:MAG: DMT family transporter [Candidatus Limnocylindrales bacterium]